ncbi:WXG100 family type VII secretion target [Amycolatopsis sp. NPDC059657]|uniref:WXG100 family type VII secretion target n=1 Tax=Amycolatopsis sp. NPDC059657 TaxID=3346899 RepID=UPI0036716320
MADQKVATELLEAHGRGSEDAASNFGSLADLLQQARVNDDCFGPIGEPLAFKYFEGLQECQDLANQAKGFFEDSAERLKAAVKMYREMDLAATEALGQASAGLDDVGAGPGSLNDLNHGGDGERKSYMEQHSGYGSSWASTASDVARASSPPDIAIAAVNTRLEQLQAITSPGKAFIDNGLGWLISIVISPLVEFILEPAIGDPGQMRSTAKGWEKVADWVEKSGQHEQERADATKQGWEGGAGDAFRTQMTEFGDGASAFANDLRGVQQILEFAADMFDMFVEIVVDIIQELVIGLIIEWLAALATSWCTAGASTVAAGATTTVQLGRTGSRLGMEVSKLLTKLQKELVKLEKLLQRIRTGPMRGIIEKAGKTPFIKKNPAVKILNNFDEATGYSKTANRFAKGRDGASALATNLAEVGVKAVTGMSGAATVGAAAKKAAKGVVPGEAVEQGVKYGYSKAEDPSTEAERREQTDRGFTYDE